MFEYLRQIGRKRLSKMSIAETDVKLLFQKFPLSSTHPMVIQQKTRPTTAQHDLIIIRNYALYL